MNTKTKLLVAAGVLSGVGLVAGCSSTGTLPDYVPAGSPVLTACGNIAPMALTSVNQDIGYTYNSGGRLSGTNTKNADREYNSDASKLMKDAVTPGLPASLASQMKTVSYVLTHVVQQDETGALGNDESPAMQALVSDAGNTLPALDKACGNYQIAPPGYTAPKPAAPVKPSPPGFPVGMLVLWIWLAGIIPGTWLFAKMQRVFPKHARVAPGLLMIFSPLWPVLLLGIGFARFGTRWIHSLDQASKTKDERLAERLTEIEARTAVLEEENRKLRGES